MHLRKLDDLHFIFISVCNNITRTIPDITFAKLRIIMAPAQSKEIEATLLSLPRESYRPTDILTAQQLTLRR